MLLQTESKTAPVWNILTSVIAGSLITNTRAGAQANTPSNDQSSGVGVEIFLTSNIFLISRYKTYFVKLLRTAFSKKITVKLCVSLRLSGNIQFCKFLEEKFMVGDTPLFRVIRTTAIPPRQIELKSCFDRKLNYFTRRT